MDDSTLLDADLKDNRGVVKLESQASLRPALLNDERAAGSSSSHSKHGRLSLPAGDDEEAQRLLPPSQRQRHRIDPQSRRYWPHQQPASTCASSPYFPHKIAGFSTRLILLLLLLLMIGVAFQFTNRTCLSSASVNQRAPTTDDLHHPLPIRRGQGAPVDRLIDFSGRWVQNNVTNGYTTGWQALCLPLSITRFQADSQIPLGGIPTCAVVVARFTGPAPQLASCSTGLGSIGPLVRLLRARLARPGRLPGP